MRLLSYNIRFGGTGREKLIAAVINACDPDIVILQEATHPEVVQQLALLCDMPAWGALRGHSLAFLSRLELARHAWRSIRLARRRYLELELAESGTRLFGVHLAAIHSNVTELRRTYELRSILRGITPSQLGFHVVTGDFNTLAPGEVLDVRRLPPRLQAIVWMTGRTIRFTAIRHMLEEGYSDGYRLFHKPEVAGYTFPTWDPHVRLDYAFVPTSFASRMVSCEIMRDLPGVHEASDHFPLLSELT